MVTVAMPLALVLTAHAVVAPEPQLTEALVPAVMATVMAAPGTALLKASRARTDGAVATAVATVADWPFPVLITMVLTAPGLAVAVKVRRNKSLLLTEPRLDK